MITLLDSNIAIGIVQSRHSMVKKLNNVNLQDKKFDEFVQIFLVLWAQIAVHHDPSLLDIQVRESERD